MKNNDQYTISVFEGHDKPELFDRIVIDANDSVGLLEVVKQYDDKFYTVKVELLES